MSSFNSSKYLSDKELSRLIPRMDALPLHLKAYFWVLICTGARASEALNIEITDMIQSKQSVVIRGLKNSRDREIVLPPSVFEMLNSLTENSSKPFQFGLRNAEKVWHEIRPVKKPLHSLRHTLAVRLYRETRDIKLVQHVLGHASIKNTMVYTEIDLTDETRKPLLKLAGGL